jgi:Holliday junction resolvase RusA-like endonuclease
MSISFIVRGIPQPGGSKRGFPFKRKNGSMGVAISDANPRAAAWKRTVTATARESYHGKMLTGGVEIRMEFFLPRPQGHYGSGANANRLKASAPPYPVGRPDVLKLSRVVEDGITQAANIYIDDAQIVDEHLFKRYCRTGESPRVEITIEQLTVETGQTSLLEAMEPPPPWEKGSHDAR